MSEPAAGIYAGNLDNAEKLLALLEGAETPVVTALTVVSGTAQQDTTGLPSDVYVPITGGTSGTAEVQIGATSAVATTLYTIAATANVCCHFRLPAGWFFKVTVGGSAAITASSSNQVAGG